MNLFQLGTFVLSSGGTSDFKIECDALTDEDWKCLGYLASQKLPPYRSAMGVLSRNAQKFAIAMYPYEVKDGSTDLMVWCDDVLTTGTTLRETMQQAKERWEGTTVGVVAFARKQPPEGITAVFQL